MLWFEYLNLNKNIKMKSKKEEQYMNHPGFLGSSVSTWSVIGWSLGALAILFVVGKGVKIYKEIKN